MLPMFLLIVYVLMNVIVAFSPHPGDAPGFWPAVVRGLGRSCPTSWSASRRNAPGTIKLPFAAQPEWNATDLRAAIVELSDRIGPAATRDVVMRSLQPPPLDRQPPSSGPLAPVVLLLLALGALVAIGAACTVQRQLVKTSDALAATLETQAAALQTFAAYNAQHEQELVKASKTQEEAEAALAAYRKERAPVLALMIKIRDTIGSGLAGLDKVDAAVPDAGAAVDGGAR
jgi:hypothetical protein